MEMVYVNRKEKINSIVNGIILISIAIGYMYGIYMWVMGYNPRTLDDTLVGFIKSMCMGITFATTLTVSIIAIFGAVVRIFEMITNDV